MPRVYPAWPKYKTSRTIRSGRIIHEKAYRPRPSAKLRDMKEKPRKHRPLVQPIVDGYEPDLFNTCPKCHRWFALKYVKTEITPIKMELEWYRCSKCGHEIAFCGSKPPHCL